MRSPVRVHSASLPARVGGDGEGLGEKTHEDIHAGTTSALGEDKGRGEALNKAVLADLKQLDKCAKAKDTAGVATTSGSLRNHVLEFVALEPRRLAERFGVDDL